jgi:hypothetical protein
MTSSTPKPRADEHVSAERPRRQDYQADWTFCDSMAEYATALETERDLLRERERELVEALTELAGDIEGVYEYCKRKDLMVVSIGQFRRLNAARALLAKHGR